MSNSAELCVCLSLSVEHCKEPGWTSGLGNFLQTFDIDLGSVHKLTSIDTLGRQLTNEFVSEFRLLTSNDGVHWRMYLINGIEKANCPTKFSTNFPYFPLTLPTNSEPIWFKLIELLPLICLFENIVQLFEGNSDGESVKTSYFETPIIAQYIRINPTRWGDRISMRIELYGCDYRKLVVFSKI